MTLHDQLQQTLGSTYTLERELGGGGMSRVFLAEDRTLGRKVVVKVLPPELTAGVNVEPSIRSGAWPTNCWQVGPRLSNRRRDGS